MGQTLKTDSILFWTVLLMVSFGLLMVYSASSVSASLDPHFGTPWHYLALQGIWAVIALGVMLFLKRTSYRKFQTPAVAFTAIGLTIILLIVVYIADAKSHRWLRFGSGLGIQPSELAKPAMVVFLAFFVTWRARAINNARFTLRPAALAVGLVILLVVVPDLGTAMVLGAAAAVVFFVAGLEWRYVWIAAAVAMIGVCLSIVLSPYRLARVVKFVDPDLVLVDKFDPAGHIRAHIEESLAARDTNHQWVESQVAIGAGGPFGLGLMNSRQKAGFLPKPHTDFIYAIVGEETGLIGTAGLLLAFGIIFWRGLRATLHVQDDFGRYLALGITVIVVVQGLMNISVVLGMVPTKGIPLPTISYGGSSLLSTLMLLGMLLNVSEHAG